MNVATPVPAWLTPDWLTDVLQRSGDLSGGFVELDRLYNTGRSEFHDSPVPSAVTLTGTATSGQLTYSSATPLG